MTEIPYRGGARAMLALITSEAQFAVLSTQLSAPQISAGQCARSPQVAAFAILNILIC